MQNVISMHLLIIIPPYIDYKYQKWEILIHTTTCSLIPPPSIVPVLIQEVNGYVYLCWGYLFCLFLQFFDRILELSRQCDVFFLTLYLKI